MKKLTRLLGFQMMINAINRFNRNICIGTSKDLVSEKEEIKYNNILKQ